MRKSLVISTVTCLLDQLIKLVIRTFLLTSTSIIIIPGFFSLTHVHNYGAAWSILSGNRLFLIMITFIFLFLLYITFYKTSKSFRKIEIISVGLLVGGIIGNLIDRLFLGYVVDYLAFDILGYQFPVFNLADASIVIAVVLIVIDILRGSD